MAQTSETTSQTPSPDGLFNPASPLLYDFHSLETEPTEVLAYNRMLMVVHYLHAEEAGRVGINAFFEAAQRSQQPDTVRRARLTAGAVKAAREQDISDGQILEEASLVLAKLRGNPLVIEAQERTGRSS